MINSFERSIAFRPDVRVIVYDADSVEIRSGVWSCNSVTFSDDERKGILGKIVLGLLQGRSITEIRQNDRISEDEILSVIEALTANDLLVTKEHADTWSRTAFLVAPTLGSMREVRDVPKRTILLGPATMTAFLRTALIPSFAETLDITGQDVIERLSREDLFLESNGLTSATVADAFSEWHGALVVAVWPELNPILLGNLNRLAHKINFTFFSATVDGPFAMIGPTVFPYLTPCFACTEARVLETLRDHTLYTGYRSVLAEGKVYGSHTLLMDPIQATCLSLAAWEITNIMTVGSAFTAGKLLTIYAPTLEFAFHELTRFPGCPVCRARSGLDPQLYSDLRAYLSSRSLLGEREAR